MSMGIMKITGADFSVNPMGYFPGLQALTPYGMYLMGSGYTAPSNGEMYDWSGNGRTLVKTGSPVVNAGYYNGNYSAYYETPFTETTFMTAAAGATLVSVSRGVTAGSSQIVGNIPADSSQYMGIGQTSSNIQAYLKGASAVTANRAIDAGKFGSWQFTSGRFSATQCEIGVFRTELGTIQKVLTTTSGQTFASTNVFRIGSALNTNTATRDIAAIGFYNRYLSDAELDQAQRALSSLVLNVGNIAV